MGSMILKNASLTESAVSSDIIIADSVISEIAPGASADGEVLDCNGLTLFPGFVDIHAHGAVGVDVNEADTDGLIEIGRFLASNGVTAWMPTLVPDSDDRYIRVIDAIDRLIEIQSEMPIAQAVGVHYEGVFANEKMCGALRPEYFRSFQNGPLDPQTEEKSGTTRTHEKRRVGISLPQLKRGVHMTTFAPEIEGGVDLAAELTRQGWIASIGHTRADIETLERAFDAGARHVTHFFNAMTGIHHRDIGVAGWAITRSEVTFDIIADGIHVQPQILKFACRSKTPDRTVLISDSVAPTGLGDGSFELWGESITVKGGRTQNERGSIAGSVITMLDAVRLMRTLGFNDNEVIKMASGNPARLLGLASSRGAINVGKRADIAAFDAEGSIRFVIIGGRLVEMP